MNHFGNRRVDAEIRVGCQRYRGLNIEINIAQQPTRVIHRFRIAAELEKRSLKSQVISHFKKHLRFERAFAIMLIEPMGGGKHSPRSERIFTIDFRFGRRHTDAELTSLKHIRDNYQKYLLTIDDFTGDHSGIHQLNLLDWLLQKGD